MHLNLIDVLVFLGYLVAVSAVGLWFARRRKSTTEEYFLAGRAIPWYAVGASFISSNISTEHFVGMVGAAYVYGICVAAWEWGNIWTFSILIWLFIPFLLATRVFTAPEFLERRFNANCRLLFAILTVLADIFAFLAAVLYAGAVAIDSMFDLQGWVQSGLGVSAQHAPFMAIVLAVLVIGVTTGAYSIYGGLRSVVWTDVLQCIVLFVGGILVTVLGLCALGHGDLLQGWHAMIAANQGLGSGGTPETAYATVIADNIPKVAPGATEYHRLSIFQPLNHTLVPWPQLVIGWLAVGIWYNCINQFMIQRVLAAKDSWNARMGIVFAGFMKVLLPFIVVVPGLIMFTMNPRLPNPDKSYAIMVQELIPIGIRGILLAGLFAAIQSTVSSVLNSTSTIITLDIYERFLRKKRAPGAVAGATDSHTVHVGEWISIVVIVLSMCIAPFIGVLGQGVFVYIQNLYAYFAPPFAAIFVFGMLWRRANGTGATTAIIVGLVFSVLSDLVFSKWVPWLKPFMTRATVTWFVCAATIVIVSLCTAPPPPEKTEGGTTLSFSKLNMLDGVRGYPWYKHVLFWWGLFAAAIVAMYAVFSGR